MVATLVRQMTAEAPGTVGAEMAGRIIAAYLRHGDETWRLTELAAAVGVAELPDDDFVDGLGFLVESDQAVLSPGPEGGVYFRYVPPVIVEGLNDVYAPAEQLRLPLTVPDRDT
jgi:hypothetical protein